MAAQHELLTIKEAAAIVRVTPFTFWQWIKRRKKNRPPHVRVGPTLIRIPADEFREWIKGKH